MSGSNYSENSSTANKAIGVIGPVKKFEIPVGLLIVTGINSIFFSLSFALSPKTKKRMFLNITQSPPTFPL